MKRTFLACGFPDGGGCRLKRPILRVRKKNARKITKARVKSILPFSVIFPGFRESYVLNVATAVSTGGPFINNMSIVGLYRVFNADSDPQDFPDDGTIIRITGTGWIETTIESPSTVEPPKPTYYMFFFEVLMTIRARRAGDPEEIDVESSGIISFGNGPDYCENWVLPPKTFFNIPLSGVGEVKFGASTVPHGLDVKFDQCVMEYLPAPEPQD